MSSLAKNLKTLATVIGFAAAGMATGAQAQTTVCGITGTATGSTIYYDPFDERGLTDAVVTLQLKRENNSGGGDTRVVNFYLMADSTIGTGADGTQIVPTSVNGSVNVAGLDQDIFYDYNQTKPIMTPISVSPTAANKFLKIDFTGNNTGSDTATATFRVTIPAEADIKATQQLAFNAVFTCNIQGGKANGYEGGGTIVNAVRFPVVVLSALRASFVGSALDFGEIGDVTDALASQKNTGAGKHVRVQSSGAYTISMTSENGYHLSKPGAVPNNPNDKIAYKVNFLGLERGPDNAAVPIERTCMRAGLASSADILPVLGTLIEGGSDKNPSSSYTDNLQVTITPLAYEAPATIDCGNYTIPLSAG